MKKSLLAICAAALTLCGCKAKVTDDKLPENGFAEININDSDSVKELSFDGLNDSDLLQYVEDKVLADLEYQFASDNYKVETVKAVYYSKEYVEELQYNSKSNIYFGYTIDELNKLFDGKKYVFQPNEKGETEAVALEEYFNDTKDTLIKNVAIGTGVILVCVTVSVATAGSAPAVSAIFAASAKTAAQFAAGSSVFSGVTAGFVNYYQHGDTDSAIDEALKKGSSGFKWGALVGATLGGFEKWQALSSAGKLDGGISANVKIPTPSQSEIAALQKYGGKAQVSYLAGEEVKWGMSGATRPDIVRKVKGILEAIEVKNYDLKTTMNQLIYELKREINDRVINLPEGSIQRIVLDVTGRGYDREFLNSVSAKITEALMDIYPNIPIDFLGA